MTSTDDAALIAYSVAKRGTLDPVSNQDEARSTMDDGEEERRLCLLAAIVESSDDAIVGMSCQGAILTWNRGAMEMLGYAECEAVGQPVWLLFADDAQDQLAGLLEAVNQGERVRQRQFAWVTSSGSHVEVAVTVSPVRDRTGAIVGASVTGRDVSEQRWMAATLDDAIAKLGTALADAQEAESRSRRFLADAAHQLRGPMAATGPTPSPSSRASRRRTATACCATSSERWPAATA